MKKNKVLKLFLLSVVLIRVVNYGNFEIRKYIKVSTEKYKNQFHILKTERL
ncbi:hypothetical protein [Cetobacterium sp.]|uniref:hypothetical protein n=1 Tax=Cetobacterium sp. TaxID=2071632 RepID=UPI002FCB6C72